jgi:hypothetical protein
MKKKIGYTLLILIAIVWAAMWIDLISNYGLTVVWVILGSMGIMGGVIALLMWLFDLLPTKKIKHGNKNN